MKLNLNPEPIPKCKNCGRDKCNHKAVTMNCPFGLSRRFPHFHAEQFYEPRIPKVKK